jgi:hypothetical protein
MKALFILLFLTTAIHAADFTKSVPELEGMDFKLWTTPNFVVVAEDESQGMYLRDNIENIKTWCLERWGLPDINFPNRVYHPDVGPQPGVMVICMKNKKSMMEVWRREKPYFETRKEDGKIIMNFVILVLDDNPSASIPQALTGACLEELEQQANVKFGFWAKRGMGGLNVNYSQILSKFVRFKPLLDKDSPILFSQALLNLDEEDWRASSYQEMFDVQATLLCLLLRKEHGQKKFHLFIKQKDMNQGLKQIYNFNGYDDFDRTYKRFIVYSCQDAASKKMPKSYLQILPVGE